MSGRAVVRLVLSSGESVCGWIVDADAESVSLRLVDKSGRRRVLTADVVRAERLPSRSRCSS